MDENLRFSTGLLFETFRDLSYLSSENADFLEIGAKRRRAVHIDPPPVGYPGISPTPPGGLDFAPERSSDALLPLLFSSLLSVRVFSALFPPLGPFGDQFQLILGGLGPRKHSNFIERVIKFKLVTIFASDAAWGHENHPKTFQMLAPSTPKATPEEPRSTRDRPRRAPRASPSHP